MIMNLLSDELINQFPEIAEQVGNDKDLPYQLMSHLYEWVEAECKNGLSNELIKRIVEFRDWCISSPRGQTAENDIYTIYIVGFFEHLFESEATMDLIPRLSSRENIVNNEEYLVSWIGRENYQKVLKRF